MQRSEVKWLNAGLLIIVAIGSLFRFISFSEWSLSNDELSTLYRATYDSLSEVIEKGVLTDNHPALLEIFIYYWKAIFGDSAFAIRFPFVLFGIGSLVYVQKIAALLFNKKTALLASALFATSYLFVLYSQIARPYSMGTFFVLVFAFTAFQLFLQKKQKFTIILFVLSGLLATLSHYLAAFSVFIIYLGGLLYWKQIKPLHYLLMGLSMLLLFSPHLSITLNHFGHESVGWLPTPDPSFFGDYLLYLFNDSLFLSCAVIGLAVVGVFLRYKQFKLEGRKQLLLLLFFLIPLFTTYIYSIKVGPILQYSILIFSTPFLIILLAALITPLFKEGLIFFLVALFLTVGGNALVKDQEFYEKKYFSDFKGVSEQMLEWKNTYSQDSIVFIANTNNPEHFRYYFRVLGDSVQFDIPIFKEANYTAMARDLIEQTQKPYVCLAFGNTAIPFEVHEYAKSRFPEIIGRKKMFNSEAVLYGGSPSEMKREKRFSSSVGNEEDAAKWKILPDLIQDSVLFKDQPTYKIQPQHEYALTYRDTIGNVFRDGLKYLSLEAHLDSDKEANLLMVVSIKRGDEEIYWRGTETQAFYKEGGYKMIYVLERVKEIEDEDSITIFFWNPNKQMMQVNEFSLNLYTDSDYSYYDK